MSLIKNLSIVLVCLLMTACTLTEKPSFINVDDVRVIEAKAKMVSIDANLVFYNPNDLGVRLEKVSIKPIVNEVEMGEVNTIKDIHIESKGNFEVPVNFSFNPKAMWQEEKGALIGTLINTFSNKPVKVQYKGVVTLEIAGVSFDVPIDHTEEVVLK